MSIRGTTDVFKYELVISRRDGKISWQLRQVKDRQVLAGSDLSNRFQNDNLNLTCKIVNGNVIFGVVSTPSQEYLEYDWYNISSLYDFAENYRRFRSELEWGLCWLQMI